MKRYIAILLAVIMAFPLSMIMMPVSGAREIPGEQQSRDYPAGYTHRPLVELYVGTECPHCMKEADPAMKALWDEKERGDTHSFNLVMLELEGDLKTQEGSDRFHQYQQGVGFIPDAEWDGGYIEDIGGGDPNATKDRYQQDADDSGNRNPKAVEVYVNEEFKGDSFDISVGVHYSDTGQIFRGSLYVFMVEETAKETSQYAEAEDGKVELYNVFRGFAIKDERFNLFGSGSVVGEGDTYNTSTTWKIPQQEKVPINPMNVFAVAAVFDRDDTTSQRGSDGCKENMPRAVASSTPLDTSYDLGNAPPKITNITPTYDKANNEVTFNVGLQDKDGVGKAYLWYKSEGCSGGSCVIGADENESWAYTELSGDNATGEYTATVPSLGEGKLMEYRIVAYDGAGMELKSPIFNYTAGKKSSNSSSSFSISTGTEALAFVIGGALIAVFGVMYAPKKKESDEGFDEAGEEEAGSDYVPETEYEAGEYEQPITPDDSPHEENDSPHEENEISYEGNKDTGGNG